MFKADALHLVRVPEFVSGSDPGSAYYALVEPLANLPTWLIHVLPRPDAAGSVVRWRRFLTHSLADALDVMDDSRWAEARLLILLPPNLPTEGGACAASCLAVWECLEPEGGELCWLVETDRGAFLDSLFGTEPGAARRLRQLWAAGCAAHAGDVMQSRRFSS
jgi:hypothetical protein